MIKWLCRYLWLNLSNELVFAKNTTSSISGKLNLANFARKTFYLLPYLFTSKIIFKSFNRDLRIKEFNFLRELNFPNFVNWQFSTNFCKNWFSWTQPRLAKFMKFNRFLLNFIVSYCFSFFFFALKKWLF